MKSKENHKPKTILVSVLDWGLGHATRIIPVIRYLLQAKTKVIIAGSGNSLRLLAEEFPGLEIAYLKSFSPSFHTSWVKIPLFPWQVICFFIRILLEHYELRKLLRKHQADIIISDNRYGLWHRQKLSVIITHQLHIQPPKCIRIFSGIINLINHWLLKNFDEIWVPDSGCDTNLSGELSHTKKPFPGVKFIGPLSRLRSDELIDIQVQEKKILAIVSGPEPERSRFEKILLKQLSLLGKPSVLVCGKPDSKIKEETVGLISIYNYVSSKIMELLIRNSSLIICRPGYSTIMDLYYTGGKVIFVPTPGQSEQQYLGSRFLSGGIALCVDQNKLDLESQIGLALKFSGFTGTINKNQQLPRAIKHLLYINGK